MDTDPFRSTQIGSEWLDIVILYGLRLPASLQKSVRELAKKEAVSINRLITAALAEKLSALTTVEYSDERAKRGNRRKFGRAMANVRNVKPELQDELSSLAAG